MRARMLRRATDVSMCNPRVDDQKPLQYRRDYTGSITRKQLATRPATDVRRALLRSFLFRRLDAEHLPQIGQIGLVVAHVLARGVRQFRDRLTIAANHLDHDLQRVVAEIVGQVRADAKRQLAAAAEAFIQLQDLWNIERIGEYEDLRARIAAVRLV